MKKSFATDDHSGLIEAAGGRAFQYYDRSDSMTKAASDAITRSDIANHMPPDSHFGVHLITNGSEEAFGPNRNGDSTSMAALHKYHRTFEKFGCVYREHKNRCPQTQGIGMVKLARVNTRMNRGELIVWVDKDKAPDMYKRAMAGEELSWSMSMRLPHDECSCCQRKSARVEQYCNHLKNDMLQFVPGFQKYAYARNEEGIKYFDISEVGRRADRIATYLGYTFSPEAMAKAASDMSDRVVTGAEWAEHQFGTDHLVELAPWEALTLEKLASADEFVRHADSTTLQTLAAMGPQTLTDAQIEIMAQPDFRAISGELSKRAMFVDFTTFAALVTGRKVADLEKDADFSAASDEKLPSLIGDIFRSGGCQCGADVADSVTPDDAGCEYSSEKDSIDRLISEVGDELGMKPENTQNRALKVTVMKSASVALPPTGKTLDPYFDAMAEAYGHYLIKAAHIAKDSPHVNARSMFRGLAASLAITDSKKVAIG